jgi:hypothetical protein
MRAAKRIQFASLRHLSYFIGLVSDASLIPCKLIANRHFVQFLVLELVNR